METGANKMNKFIIARPGYPYLLGCGLVTVITFMMFPPASPFFLLLTLFMGYFFRNPRRIPPPGERLVLSPADGRVMKVDQVYEPYFIQGEALKVSIFLSLFNVHINRAPFGGIISYCHYIPGKYLAAFKEEAPVENERNLIGMETACGKMLLVQVAGLVARRIVCWVRPDENVGAGTRVGMIKFSSCTELYLPLGVDIKVKEGEKVRGGETVLGQF